MYSVIIPTCDRPDLLKRALKSVLDQTFLPDEIIVVDNGLTPVDEHILKQSVKLVRALPRYGVAQARNTGAILASGQFLAFLDDDDCWDRDYLDSMRKVILEGGFDVFLSARIEKGLFKKTQSKPVSSQDAFFRELLMRNPGVTGSSLVVSRSAFVSSRGFDPYLTTGEDRALVVDLMLRGFNVTRVVDAKMIFIGPDNAVRENSPKKLYKGKIRFIKKYWVNYSWQMRILVLSKLWKRYLLGK